MIKHKSKPGKRKQAKVRKLQGRRDAKAKLLTPRANKQVKKARGRKETLPIPRLTYFDNDLARELAFIVLTFLVIGLGVFVIKPAITGLIVGVGNEIKYVDEMNLIINESTKILWQPKGYDIRSLKATGSVIGNGTVKIYLEKGSDKYLIYDNKPRNLFITGNVISDVTELKTQEKGSGNESSQEKSNETEGKLKDGNDFTAPNLKAPKDAAISSSLDYGSSTNFDIDNDGIETLTGVVDFTVLNTKFNWALDYSNVCTKWKVTSLDTFESTSLCYGSDECCKQFGFISFDSWNETFNVYYNRYGATSNNLVYAQVFYYSDQHNDFIIGNQNSLKAEFKESAKEFSEQCIETCTLSGFTEPSYNLSFDIDNSVLKLDTLTYTVFEKLENQGPALVKNISDISVLKNELYKLNLSQHFSDPNGDILGYSNYKANSMVVSYENDITTFSFTTDFTGVISTFFTTSDGQASSVSNVFTINVTESENRAILLEPVRVGKPVKWKKRVIVEIIL